MRSPSSAAPAIDLARCAQRLQPTVRRMALKLKTLLPASVELEDLIQYGIIGLLQAARHHHGTMREFKLFAIPWIRTAMLEGLAVLDSAPLELRRNLSRVRECVRSLEQQLPRPPSSRDVAKALGWTHDELLRILRERKLHHASHAGAVAVDRGVEAPHEPDPLTRLQLRSSIDALVDAIGELPRRDQKILQLRFQEEVKLEAIGMTLGISESRVCQLLKRAMSQLRARVSK